jgi:hypothetical protein
VLGDGGELAATTVDPQRSTQVAVGACDSAVRTPSASTPMTPESVHERLLAELEWVQPICAAHGLTPDETLQLAAGLVLVRVEHTQPDEVFRAMELVGQAMTAVRRTRSAYDSRMQHLVRQVTGPRADPDSQS